MSTLQSEAHKGPRLEEDHGYYSSCLINLKPAQVFKFCKEESNIKSLLKDFPVNVDLLLNLSKSSVEKINSTDYKITYQNSDSSFVAGRLIFLLKPASMNRGTYLTIEAKFLNVSFLEAGPSTLMSVFLKRMKAFIETGEYPTTRGQPSGKQELPRLH